MSHHMYLTTRSPSEATTVATVDPTLEISEISTSSVSGTRLVGEKKFLRMLTVTSVCAVSTGFPPSSTLTNNWNKQNSYIL